MNYLLLQYKLNSRISSFETVQKIKKHEFERILDNESPRVYSNVTSESTSYRNSSSNSISSMDIDNTGKFLAAGMNSGAMNVWSFDDKANDSELLTKKIKHVKRETFDDDDNDPSSNGTVDNKRSLTSKNNDSIREEHSFNLNRNKYRMYRKSNYSSTRNFTDETMTVEKKHKHRVHTIKWYKRDNGLLFSGSNDCKFKIWDTQNGFEPIQTIDMYNANNEYKMKINQIDCSSGTRSDLVLIATEDYSPRIVDLRNLNYGITFNNHQPKDRSEVLCCKFNDNPQRENFFATGEDNGRVKIWDYRNLKKEYLELTNDGETKAHHSSCNDIIWNNSGNQLITIATDGKIKKWDPFSNDLDHKNRYQLLGNIDINRNRYKKRVSQRLNWQNNEYLTMNTDYNELTIYNTNSNKLYTKLKNPWMGHKNYPQIDALTIQSSISNSIGTRIIIAIDNSILEYI